MRKLIGIIIGLCVVLGTALAAVIPASAGTFSPAAPKPPAGWHATYSHNFATTPGLADWVVQPGGAAKVTSNTKKGAEFGLGITLTSADQWEEVISSDAVVGPTSFVQALVYIPPAKNGTTANWPAFWSSNQPWPSSGEDDMLEGQQGSSCFHTHYGATAATEINSASYCPKTHAQGVNWITVSTLRQNGHVRTWYDGDDLGLLPLPPTANDKLMFQTQSQAPGKQGQSNCPQCFGPLTVPSTAYLSRVSVYAP